MIKGVLFDLDGTLLDTAPDLVASLNHVRTSEGLHPLPFDELRNFASRGSIGLILAGMPEADAETTEARKLSLLAHYENNLHVDTRPFDGVLRVLSELAARNMPWGIVTNKPEYLTHPLLKLAGLNTLTQCVVCGDTLEHSKPHPAPVRHAVEALGLLESEVLMVGDDWRDLEAGKAAGTVTVFAAYGYVAPGSPDHMAEADWQIDMPSQLLDVLDQLG